MNELHPIGVTEEFRHKLEQVGPGFLQAGILAAREKSWEVFRVIKKEMKEGLTEKRAREIAKAIFHDYGCNKHWHQPSIRFGKGTRHTFHQPLREDGPLEINEPVFIDLGPVWYDPISQMEYEGDVGDSFVYGENEEANRCINAIHILFQEGREYWLREKCTGEFLYQRIREQAKKLGYPLVENVVGHRLGDFPHQKYTKQELPKLEFQPSPGLWILELQIAHPTLPIGAFFEDLLI